MSLLPVSLGDVKGSGPREGALFCLRFVTKRYILLAVTLFALGTLLFRIRWPGRKLPPLYPQWHHRDLALPQHRWHATDHSREPKFFFVPGHTRGSGWGNVFQEILLNAHLAYKMDRAAVFYNYTWSEDGDYSDYNGKPIPSRIPLSALIRGPIVGDAFPADKPSPPAIAEDYWNHACAGRIRSIERTPVHATFKSWYMHDVTDGWVDHMKGVDDQCVEVMRSTGNIFDWVMFGDRHALHGLWAADLPSSPILTHFGWSALVELAFDANRAVFSPAPPGELPLSAVPFTNNKDRYTELPGLLVLHIRRGDYEGHCAHLARWSSTFLAFNGLPGLAEFTAPPGGPEPGTATEEGMAVYLDRCYPSVARIVEHAERARADELAAGRPALERVFKALLKTGHFAGVSSSRDLELGPEQRYVGQAVDMLVGQRAQVFIGNGWSSLTGGTVIMRMANGFRTATTRFF
ncbi:uncharacterized protein BXZ73DRAFT_91362 [Epithele typhae]|uniref:uncharacterized protein n=1 Tax=Epithele typhae TaxID=378194 RepID=UPI002008B8D1|nr:uncharacterized protein BXZ73DRAFT_91362 [Epithele typhae]KAH9923952.1 hypothetical protein BXZ73DRAFT_91362 [Epithele typhae]